MEQTFELPVQGGVIALMPHDGERKHGVVTEPGEWLLIIFGSNKLVKDELTTNAQRCIPRTYNFKHHAGDHKYWTQEQGYDYPFAVRKSDLRLLDKETWSYPILVLPGGEQIKLSTSGSSGSKGYSWFDWLPNEVEACINHPVGVWKALNALAVKSGTPFDGWKTPQERAEEFYQVHANDWLVNAAWGDWQDGVPKGKVLVVAQLGRHRAKDKPERWFLVDAAKYEQRQFQYVIEAEDAGTDLRA